LLLLSAERLRSVIHLLRLQACTKRLLSENTTGGLLLSIIAFNKRIINKYIIKVKNFFSLNYYIIFL